MSLNYLAITPHPPLIINEIGGERSKHVNKTIVAMEKVARNFSRSDIDTVLCISPHGKLTSFAMTIYNPKSYLGDFSDFGHSEITLISDADYELVEKIIISAIKTEIPINIEDSGQLDHGVMVPLYFLKKFTLNNFKLVEIGYSNLPIRDHLLFGEIIGKEINKYSQRVAVISSGDLSHRHLDNHYKKYALKFDKLIEESIISGDFDQIINIDSDLVDYAGECAYKSLLIMLGIVEVSNIKLELLSYENPYGVGYLVADSG